MAKETQWNNFVVSCIDTLNKYNIKILLQEDLQSRGYWLDASDCNLVFACNITGSIDHWGRIFAHEYCHFLQWKDRCPEWQSHRGITKKDLTKVFNNKLIKKEDLDYILNVVRDVELDCEKRTVQLLKQHELGVNLDNYRKVSNIYVHSFNYIKEYRHKLPIDVKSRVYRELFDASPSEFYDNYDKIPEDLHNQFKKSYPVTEKNKIR